MHRDLVAAGVELALLVCIGLGCGGPGNIGRVSGTVTLDGQPLANALVIFSPKKGGSPSAGRTDTSGAYSLQYTNDIAGAEIGEHAVTVTTFQGAVRDADPPVPRTAERVPVKYNTSTELVGTVASGSNTLNFDLKSDGPVVQPDGIRE